MIGRIAYLPVDVTVNASFVPDDILNVDGCVLLVGGQPTNSWIIWTSLVDLRKVHTAHMWLRDNNKYYENIYSTQLINCRIFWQNDVTSERDDDMHRSAGKASIHKLNQLWKFFNSTTYVVQVTLLQTHSLTIHSFIDYQAQESQGNCRKYWPQRWSLSRIIPNWREWYTLCVTCLG